MNEDPAGVLFASPPPLGAATEDDRAGANKFFNTHRPQQLDNRIDLGRRAGDFHRIGTGRDIDDLGAENIDDTQHFGPGFFLRCRSAC